MALGDQGRLGDVDRHLDRRGEGDVGHSGQVEADVVRYPAPELAVEREVVRRDDADTGLQRGGWPTRSVCGLIVIVDNPTELFLASWRASAPDRPVVAVLCEATDRPPGLDGLAVDFRYCAADGLAEAVRGARGLMLWDFFSTAVRDVWAAADALEWIHVTAAGVDTLLFDELRDSSVVVTNAHGIFDRPIAEYVLGAVLAHAKDSRRSFALQRQHVWEHRETPSILDSRVLVVGTGAIGRAVARLLRAVGMSVRGVGRVARPG